MLKNYPSVDEEWLKKAAGRNYLDVRGELMERGYTLWEYESVSATNCVNTLKNFDTGRSINVEVHEEILSDGTTKKTVVKAE